VQRGRIEVPFLAESFEKESGMIRSRPGRGARAIVALTLSAAAAAGCDFSNRTGLAAGIDITVSSESLSIAQGSSGSVTVTLSRLNGFAEPVAVVVDGLPAGATAGALTLGADQTTGTLTITVANSTVPGATPLTLHAHSSGAAPVAATASLELIVQPGGPSFSLSLEPAIVGVAQGASRTSTLTITRFGGYLGAVELAATTLPPGVTALLNPRTVTATTATLTLTASRAAATGAARVTVTGAGTGVASQSASVTVNVTPAGGAPAGNVSVAFCPITGTPLWVAFRDGSAPWVLSTESNGSYTGQVSSGRGGLAYVVARPGGGFELNVRYGTTTELQGFGEVVCFGATGAGKSVNATVTGAGAADLTLLGLGTSAAAAPPGGPVVLTNVPAGSLDLVGARSVPGTTGATPGKLFVERGLEPADGSTVSVDFTGPSALDPVSGTATLGNLASDRAVLSVGYRTANRTFLQYAHDTASAAGSRSFGGFPPFAGSFHLLQVVAAPTLSSSDRTRSAGVIHAAVGSRTLTLGPELGSITVQQAGTSPPLRLEAAVPAAAYRGSWSVTFSQGTGAQRRSASVHATAGYFGGSPTTVTLVVPELSTAAGFNDVWGLAEAATTNWSVIAQNLSGFGERGEWQEGASFVAAVRSGTFSHHQ
jgi:hypothetical protein